MSLTVKQESIKQSILENEDMDKWCTLTEEEKLAIYDKWDKYYQKKLVAEICLAIEQDAVWRALSK